MNWDRIEGNWKQVAGKAKLQWGKLTGDDLDVIAGRREQMVGKVQERTEWPRTRPTSKEKMLCDILTAVPMHIDRLSRELSLPASKTLALLSGLEMKGLVRQAEGKRFYLAHT